jgi:hypothetical protein
MARWLSVGCCIAADRIAALRGVVLLSGFFLIFSALISLSVRPVILEPGIFPAGYPAGDRDGRPGIGL